MSTEPLAIVGLSCRLPGSANDLNSLWGLLAAGSEAWSPVPAERFNETAFHHPNANDPNGTNNHQGGHFIDGDIRDFDHAFFRLSPQQAAAMDPQQRILLELSYEALENAGLALEASRGSRTAVYAAIFGMDYERNLCKDALDLPVYQSVGTGAAILANRISYVFDLHGPSVTLDTGCSGGLVSLHYACQSLRNGESDAALVGAANLQLMPDHYIGMSNQHMVSSSGRCYPFDIRGEGYGRGEGFVVVVLKRLSDALKNRDPIRSIILNTGMNQDGYTASGITHPNRVAQADLIRETYARVKLRPQDVAYVEAHGTGTVAGDNEELAAITEVFAGRDRSLPLYVGSNKGSIGHTESTSGLASLLKAVAMLNHKVIPPVAGFIHPKPGLPLGRIHIPRERLPWPRGIAPRISINSFGYGGTNAHAIVERGPQTQREPPDSDPARSYRLFVLSANSQSSLRSMLNSHAAWIEQHPRTSLADISYTLCHRRSALPWRFTCVADNSSSLVDGLRQGYRAVPSKPVLSKKDVIFVFTGQGAQWAGMGRELLLVTDPSSVYRSSIHASREILRELGATWDLEDEILRPEDSTNINKAELAQPATTAVQIAIVALLRAQGVRPSVVVGHSSGEIAAAYAAGRLSQRAALRLAFHRGFMAAASKERGLPRGAMLSVGLGERDAAPYVEGFTQGQAVIACVNSPASVTVSGDATAIDEVMARIADRGDGTFCRKLLVDTAYHSHHMRAVADEYRARLGGLVLTEDGSFTSNVGEGDKQVIFISSVTGLPAASELGVSYWVDNLVSPVRFSDAIQMIARTHHKRGGGHAIFVEIGPHPALAGPVRQCLTSPDVPKLEYDYLSVLQRRVDAVSTALALAGRLFERGVKLDFDEVSTLAPGFEHAAVEPGLPTYSWDHSMKHWHESRLDREYRMRREPYHHLVGVRMIESSEPRWRHMVDLATLPWLADHIIDGLAIFPGAGYVCMAAEAIVQLAREQYPDQVLEALAFRDISFLRALVVPAAPQRVELQLSLKRQPDISPLSFTFSVTALSDGHWHEQSSGFVEGVLAIKAEGNLEVLGPQVQDLWSDGVDLNTEGLYAEMAGDGNTYGPAFRGLRSITLAADATQSAAVVEVPDIAAIMPAQHQAQHILHPATFDSMFHVGIPMIRHLHGAGSVMPVHISELLISTKTPALSSPGSKLNVSANLTSSHFRATHIDMTVTTDDGSPAMSAFGIESRSLAAYTRGVDSTSDASAICYELGWQQDLDFLRTSDLPEKPTLEDLIGSICFKSSNLSILELGAGNGDLSLAFLTGISAHGGTISTYDYCDTTFELFDKARKRLIGYPVRYRILDTESDLELQGFAPHASDVVIVSDIGSVAHAWTLVKGTGLVVLVLKPESSTDDTWRTALEKSCSSLAIQLSFVDAVDGSLVVVARDIDVQAVRPPSRVRILTHSARHVTPSWVAALEAGLGEKGAETSHETLNSSSIHPEADTSTCIMVIDDLSQPILSDEHCFEAAIALLQQKSRILWLSLDDPPSMYQVTGVARTAHAENDDLRLTTVHVASDVLGSNRLIDLLSSWLSHVADKGGAPHHEREYRVSKDAAVLIPRLHRSARLNRAISTPEHQPLDCAEVETCSFIDAPRTLVLRPDESWMNSNSDVVFVEDPDSQATDLADDAVDIETQAFVLSKSDGDDMRASSLGQYAGIVTHVGKAVRNLVPGDAVLALSLDGVPGANHLRIPASYACRQPDRLVSQPAVAAALFLPVLASSHALYHLARLPKAQGVVLVHGALSDLGRATVTVARSLGASITATAADAQEALRISQQLDIQAANIIVGRPSLLRPRYQDDNTFQLDAIIHAGQGEDVVPAVAWACLKPFGNVIFFQGSSSSPSLATLKDSKLPRNATVQFCHISDILRVSPDHTARLVTQAAEAIQMIPDIVRGLNLVIHDVSHVSEALRLLKLKTYNRVVLQAGPSSLVRVTASPSTDRLATEDASYVVAGGLGDLGRRLLLLMARRGAAHLVTFSRRRIDPEDYRAFQAELELVRPGCRLHCLVCDVTSERSVQDAATALASSGVPPVRGVIQSAVLLQDRTLENMRFQDFRPVTLAKIEGTLALEKYFTSPTLEFFLMLSSTVVVTGASGQANYNAGNAVQDALAHARGPGFVSLNIGWIEDAIHTSNDKTRLQGLWRTGLRPIQSHELSRYFDYILGAASGRSPLRQAVIGFDAESLSHTSAGNSNVQSALFCHVRDSPTGGTTSSTPDMQSFEEIVASGDSDAVVDSIATAITGQLTKLISVDATQINERDGSILELGLDSLIAIELRNWITREFSAPLQSSEIMADQPIRNLAQKVASRSTIVSSGSGVEGNSEESWSDPGTPASSNAQDASYNLPPLPLPELESTLGQFEALRSAIDNDDDRRATSEAVRTFLSGPGPLLHQQVQEAGSDDIADAYERQVYLERREPLPESGQFTFVHPIDAPIHSQARRAAILTVAAIEFSRRLINGEVAPDKLHGEPLTSEGRGWLFHATRRPGLGVDHMQRHVPNRTVAVLRRGHVFRLELPDAGQHLHLQAVQTAYDQILQSSDESGPSVCTLTADQRDSWATLRQDLEREPENGTALACIDTAAFVMCLDDGSPSNSGERWTQFLLNGAERPFTNRWLDKTLQLVVSANGLSAETYEHTKLDGLDARRLHAHLVRALRVSAQREPADVPSTDSPCLVHELAWKVTPAVIQRIEHVTSQCRSYGPLDHRFLDTGSLSLVSLRDARSPPNATAHLTVLLALYLIDGQVRPAWEKVSLGTFARGRVEWVQTVSPAARAFIEAAAGGSRETIKTRALLNEAAAVHSRTLLTASRGRGAVGPLYALRGVAQQQQGGELPEFFKTRAWDATRRGGPGQDVKVGFMRFQPDDAAVDDDSSSEGHWDEAGFLVSGERGVYIHCNVREKSARFAVSGRPSYVAKVCEALQKAAEIIANCLRT